MNDTTTTNKATKPPTAKELKDIIESVKEPDSFDRYETWLSYVISRGIRIMPSAFSTVDNSPVLMVPQDLYDKLPKE